MSPVKNGECLRFFLTSASDFQVFHNAVTEELQSTVWLEGPPENDIEEVEEVAEE